ncbi:MAG: SIS domain-containing protein [Anaerolineales bacterium]|nr:SIS domain-containing protein [Anaerolineales bacterium]MDW8162932.1 SIS domain-containing protein [Anaerolineales bacterium]
MKQLGTYVQLLLFSCSSEVVASKVTGIDRYIESVSKTLEKIRQYESQRLLQVAEEVLNSILQGGVLHIFGAGHAHLLAEEITYRAGGLVPVNPILDIGYTLMANPPSRTTALERLEGYARTLVENYDLRAGEVLIIFSQSGINPGPIEVAFYGKEKGLKVVAITSVEQSRSQSSRHSSGKRLFELADIVIDTHIPPGDACIEIAPQLPKVAPLSTVIGAAILQSLVAEVALRWYQTQATPPPIWMSANLPEGDRYNQLWKERFPSRRLHF